MMEFLILLLLSSGLYRQTHAAAMTAHANRGFGAVGWNGMPVPSRARGAAGRAMPPFAAQCGVTRDSAATVRRAASRQPPAASRHLLRVPTARQSGTRQLPGGTRPLTAAKPRVCAFRFVVVAWKSGVHRPALSSGSLLRHRHRHRHLRGAAQAGPRGECRAGSPLSHPRWRRQASARAAAGSGERGFTETRRQRTQSRRTVSAIASRRGRSRISTSRCLMCSSPSCSKRRSTRLTVSGACRR